MTSCILLLSFLVSASPITPQAAPRGAAKQDPPAPQVTSAPKRKLLRRSLAVTDDTVSTVPEIHVAAGVPTSLTFHQPINEKSIVLADSADLFLPVRSTATSLMLIPKRDVPEGTLATITLSLADGTVLPFVLGSSRDDADVQIDIDVRLEKKSSGDSPQALKTLIGQLRTQLDECAASSDAAALSKLASFVLHEESDKAQPFERHDVHKLDKQNRLLVEVKQVYRFFGHTYVFLTIENRDASRAWVLDRPEIALSGDGHSVDLKVATFSSDTTTLKPDELQKLVFAFPTPAQATNQRFTISLFEKNGNRHVRLENVSL